MRLSLGAVERSRSSDSSIATSGACTTPPAVCANGELLGVYRKRRLPNSDVFDEYRYFVPGDEPLRLYEIAGVPVGVSICEDAWRPGGPILDQANGGAQLIVNINGSPYHAGKIEAREAILEARADEASCTILYINLVGGQDELVFDGASLVISPDGEVITRASQYAEDLFVTDVELAESARPYLVAGHPGVERVDGHGPDQAWRNRLNGSAPEAEVYGALVLGTRDYVRKNGFTDVVFGLVRRHRLVVGRDHRRRRPRCRARAWRAHAVSVFE